MSMSSRLLTLAERPTSSISSTTTIMSTTMSTLSNPMTFLRFKDLPKEIRVTIWEQALPGPRIVHLKPRALKGGTCSRVSSEVPNDDAGNEAFFNDPLTTRELYHRSVYHPLLGQRTCKPRLRVGVDFGPRYCYAPWTDTEPPDLLLVCRESHDVASKVYTQCFASLGTKPTIWLSLDLDTIYMDYEDFDLFYPAPFNMNDFGSDITRIERFLVGSYRGPNEIGLPLALNWMEDFGHMKEFIIGLRDHPSGETSDLVLMDFVLFDREMAILKEGYSEERDHKLERLRMKYRREKPEEFIRDIQLFRDVRLAVRRDGKNQDMVMPKITRKMIVSREKKDSYDEARKAYELGRDLLENKVPVTVTGAGFLPLSYVVTTATTAQDMALEFGSARNVALDKNIVIRRKFCDLAPATRIFGLKKFREGENFEAVIR